MQPKELLSKIALARQCIKSKKLKKDGTNEYSNYNYYTPEYVDALVTEASNEANIMCVFNLQCDQFGYYGEIETFDLETGESIKSVMRTEKPTITATNAAQQMGGMSTYTRRYALMSLFNIEDNTVDFDAHDNRQGKEAKPKSAPVAPELLWLNEGTPQWTESIKWLAAGHKIESIKKKYRISKKNEEKLLNEVNIPA